MIFLIIYGILGLIFGIFYSFYSFEIFCNSKMSFLEAISFTILAALMWPFVLWSDFITPWFKKIIRGN